MIIPGDMGRYWYVLAGTARRDGGDLRLDLPRRRPPALPGPGAPRGPRAIRSPASWRSAGIEVLARGKKTLGEEMRDAYKDVADVVEVMARAGITRLVARLEPMA